MSIYGEVENMDINKMIWENIDIDKENLENININREILKNVELEFVAGLLFSILVTSIPRVSSLC